MDDSVCILFENINPHAAVEFQRAAEKRRKEENEKLQESFRNCLTKHFDMWKNHNEWNSGVESEVSLDEPEEDSSNDVPLIRQTGDVLENLHDQDDLLSSPDIMLDTDDDTDEELDQYEKIEKLFKQFEEESLSRRLKRKNIDSVNQAEVASHEGEPSTSFEIPKASLYKRKVDNVKKPKTEQPILPLEQHPFYSIPPSFSSNHHIPDNILLLPPDDQKPGCSRASTSALPTFHNWANQPPPFELLQIPHDPDLPIFSAEELGCVPKVYEFDKLLRPLPSADQKPAQTPTTASTSALPAPHNFDQPPPVGEWWIPRQAPPPEPRSSAARKSRILQNLDKLISSSLGPLPSDDQKTARIPPPSSTASASAFPPPHNWEYQAPPIQHQTPRQEPYMPHFMKMNEQLCQNFDNRFTSSLYRLPSDGQKSARTPPHSTASTSALPAPLHNWMYQPMPPPLPHNRAPLPSQQQAPRQQETYMPRLNADGETDAQFFENLDNILTDTLRRLPPAAEKPTMFPPPYSRAPLPAHRRITRVYQPPRIPIPPHALPHWPPPPFQRRTQTRIKIKAANVKKPKQIAHRVLPEDIILPYPDIFGRMDGFFDRMFPVRPLMNMPAFFDELPELATASKPEPQKSYQKEKKLKTWKEEFEKDDYNTLVALNDMGLVANVEPFECPICFTEIPVGEGVLLHDCLHSFCRDCLEGTIKHSDTVLVRCPFANEEYLCESHLQDREIKSLVPPDVYEKHLARSLALAEIQAPDSYHCKTPDCPGWCLIEENVSSFVCPACKMTNCLTCRAVHHGRNCKQYQDWLLELKSDTSNETNKTRQCLKDMVTKGKAMECPVCHVILMKISGCDALTCRMCQTQLCWVTKKTRWGPGGRGDTSGGCKCDLLNGIRCHPKCTGCH